MNSSTFQASSVLSAPDHKDESMNVFSRINMAEVTRLTRAGKLSEAVALLQGKTTPSHADLLRSTPAQGRERQSLPPQDRSAPLGRFQRRLHAFGTAQPTDQRFTSSGLLPGTKLPGDSPLSAPAPIPAGARFEERSFADAAGQRTYKVFVPSGYRGQSLPLVIMLHGCTQNPDDFAVGTGMNALAEEQTFLVAYPRQPKSANMQKCWNWFNVSDQRRESGEPALIAGIALAVLDEFSADRNRVYVAGLSAGGAAAAIMAATYPDIFAAVGVHSGLACGVAKDLPTALAAMSTGGAGRGRARIDIPTIVFHGDNDRTVNPTNADQVIAQASETQRLAVTVTEGKNDADVTYTRSVHSDSAGREIIEKWVVHGGGHAWSGGSPAGSYTASQGPDASREMMRFFLSHRKNQ
ncbi:Esterase [Hyphomicrobiales bacterium]|nr:Esterase [Hyphomicrobiales bacterium]CAH1692802.1 Esterase [Hyphomicrobiales bacterium]